MGIISTGLKAEQKGPAKKEKTEDVREEGETARPRSRENINQQVSTGSLERRESENTQN